MDLFSFSNESDPEYQGTQPLSERLRPRTLEDMLGQAQLLDAKTPWRQLIDSGQLPSLILWGPPGTGKTTFALLVAQKIDGEVVSQNAIEMGSKALRELGEAAHHRRVQSRRRTVLFIDEIHRLNKAQQDVLLPFVEKGDVLLIGATTENPSYELNAALLSRCRILTFERLAAPDLKTLFSRAAELRDLKADALLTPEAFDAVAEMADGDGRRLLNLASVLLDLYQTGRESVQWPVSAESLHTILDSNHLRYDKKADEHYDTISAFIKSVRGSDPDAAIYYLARMIKGGEDPVFIARRLVVLASEDIGNADPRGLSLAISGLQAVELIGWPEAAISLAQVTTYLASAPKSNRSYVALNEAKALVEKTGSLPIPLALRSAKTAVMQKMGYGKDYKYSHESAKGYVAQNFLPDEIKGTKFYEPTDHGFEKNIRQYLEWLKS